MTPRHYHVSVCGKCDHLLSQHRGNQQDGFLCPCGCAFRNGDAEYPVCQAGGSCMGPWGRWEAPMSDEQGLTVREVADRMKVSRARVYKLVEKGRLRVADRVGQPRVAGKFSAGGLLLNAADVQRELAARSGGGVIDGGYVPGREGSTEEEEHDAT